MSDIPFHFLKPTLEKSNLLWILRHDEYNQQCIKLLDGIYLRYFGSTWFREKSTFCFQAIQIENVMFACFWFFFLLFPTWNLNSFCISLYGFYTSSVPTRHKCPRDWEKKIIHFINHCVRLCTALFYNHEKKQMIMVIGDRNRNTTHNTVHIPTIYKSINFINLAFNYVFAVVIPKFTLCTQCRRIVQIPKILWSVQSYVILKGFTLVCGKRFKFLLIRNINTEQHKRCNKQ